MWLTSGRASGQKKMLLQYSSFTPMEEECYEGEVQPYWTMTLASGGESDVPACDPPASFSVHLASSAVTPVGSVNKSRGENVVRMWVQLKR